MLSNVRGSGAWPSGKRAGGADLLAYERCIGDLCFWGECWLRCDVLGKWQWRARLSDERRGGERSLLYHLCGGELCFPVREGAARSAVQVERRLRGLLSNERCNGEHGRLTREPATLLGNHEGCGHYVDEDLIAVEEGLVPPGAGASAAPGLVREGAARHSRCPAWCCGLAPVALAT